MCFWGKIHVRFHPFLSLRAWIYWTSTVSSQSSSRSSHIVVATPDAINESEMLLFLRSERIHGCLTDNRVFFALKRKASDDQNHPRIWTQNDIRWIPDLDYYMIVGQNDCLETFNTVAYYSKESLHV